MEHKDVVDPNIHEPKGVATASAGTVYVANGAGSGSWTTPSAGSGGSATAAARGSFGSGPGFPGQGLSNVASITRAAAGTYSVVFTTPIATGLYQVVANGYSDGAFPNLVFYATDKTVYGFTLTGRNLSGANEDAVNIDFIVFGS